MSLNDIDLACKARAGSVACFEELVRRYQVPLLRFLQRRSPRPADAEDALQEAFLKAFLSLKTYNEKYPFKPWLFTLAYRVAVSGARKAELRLVKIEDHDSTTKSEDSPENRMDQGESRTQLWDTARRVLSDDQFTALWLHYAEAMPAPQIGKVMGRSWVWVKTTLHRARRRLRDELDTPARSDAARFSSAGPEGRAVPKNSSVTREPT